MGKKWISFPRWNTPVLSYFSFGDVSVQKQRSQWKHLNFNSPLAAVCSLANPPSVSQHWKQVAFVVSGCGAYRTLAFTSDVQRRLVQGDTKKRELLKNQTKIEEIQRKKNLLTERCWPFHWSTITKLLAQGPCSAVLPTVHGCHYAFQSSRFFVSPCTCSWINDLPFKI